MFAVRNALRITPRLSGIISRNNSHLVCTPPTVKVTKVVSKFALYLILRN